MLFRSPDYLRRVLWTPPRTRDSGDLLDAVVADLRALGARSWQVALVGPVLTRAILQADDDARTAQEQERERRQEAESDEAEASGDEEPDEGEDPSEGPSVG